MFLTLSDQVSNLILLKAQISLNLFPNAGSVKDGLRSGSL